jgi:hypothetical protein
MNVKELIEFLQQQPQELPVAYVCCSEQCMLETDDIGIEELCEAREDGWVANYRPDKATIPYLVFPGI